VRLGSRKTLREMLYVQIGVVPADQKAGSPSPVTGEDWTEKNPRRKHDV